LGDCMLPANFSAEMLTKYQGSTIWFVSRTATQKLSGTRSIVMAKLSNTVLPTNWARGL
jgi:hypothetical protein